MRYLPRPYEPEPDFTFNITIGQTLSVAAVFMLAYVLPSLAYNWINSKMQHIQINSRVAGVNTITENSSQQFILADALLFFGILLILITFVGLGYILIKDLKKKL